MYQRSNSSSHIPTLGTRLFATRESGIPGPTRGTLRRSQSTSRLSHNEKNTNKKPQRTSSLEKLSLPRWSKATPINNKGRSNSATRITPGSSVSQHCGSALSRNAQSSALKERKTIQKLASDKKWVSVQYEKIQQFILESELFDKSYFSATNAIKPPSIKTFIYVSEVLLKALFPKVSLTNANYKVVLPDRLRVLKYPGKFTNSTLITVNTMNSWPQVIGMWGFLLDKVIIQMNTKIDNPALDETLNHALAKIRWNYFADRYIAFNRDACDGEQDPHAQYTQIIRDLLDVDQAEHDKLRARVSELEELNKKSDLDVDKLLAEKEELENQITATKTQIHQTNESIATQEAAVDDESNRLRKAVEKAKTEKNKIKMKIKSLEEAIKIQPCTYQEKLELLKKIDKLGNEINIIKEKISYAHKIKSQMDEKLNNEMLKLQYKVREWNKSLLEISIMKPDMKNLMLRETGFHHKSEFINEIEEMIKLKTVIENQVAENTVKIEAELNEMDARKKAMEEEIVDLEKQLDWLNRDIREKTEVKGLVIKEIGKVQLAWEQEMKVHKQELNDTQITEIIELKNTELLKLKSNLEALEIEITEQSQKLKYFFNGVGEQAMKNISEMMNIMKTVENRYVYKAKQALERQKSRIQMLENLNGQEPH